MTEDTRSHNVLLTIDSKTRKDLLVDQRRVDRTACVKTEQIRYGLIHDDAVDVMTN